MPEQAATALVTGISGQDGTLLAECLLDGGAQVHGFIRSLDEIAPWPEYLRDRVTIHVGEMTDTALVERLLADLSPDEVYNLAGISSVAYSWREPVETGLVSGVGAVGVFEAAWRASQGRKRPIRVLQASSAEIFGRADEAPQTESTPVAPVTPYGAAKAYAHHMASVYRERGLPVATCVLFNHESPLRPPTFVTRKITAAAARIARDGGELVLGDMGARRDWGWAADYVDAMIRAVRHEPADDYVIATGQTHTVGEFVEAAMAHAGVDDWQAHVRIDPRFLRPADAPVQVGDASRARAVLGWTPAVGFGEIVARMVDHDMALLGSSRAAPPVANR